MKTIAHILIGAITSLLCFSVNAQNDLTLPEQLEAMKKMEIMVGDWKGEGWMQQGQSQRSTFTVIEQVEVKNGGATLLVQGLGKDPSSGATVHDALAIIYFDANAQEYKFDTHLAKGQHKLVSGTMNNNIFAWGFELPNKAQIRYTITFTDTTWNEVGEYSPDKANWYKFLEMNLTKQ